MPIRRMSSTDDMINRVAIICSYVPNKYNKIFFMKKHFSRFGEVVKVFPILLIGIFDCGSSSTK
jgi:hypothetical protein